MTPFATFKTIFSSIVLAALLCVLPGVANAQQNPFIITITKDGTTKATIKAVSAVTSIGNITVVTASGSTVKLCSNVNFTANVQSGPCAATGLATGIQYYAVVTSGDSSGNSYKGTQSFYMGSVVQTPSSGATTGASSTTTTSAGDTCTDGIDNDGDGRADYEGAIISGVQYPPDPSCITRTSQEVKDDVSSTIIPCTNKCDLNSVFALINNIINFLLKDLLFPIVIIIFIYAGFKFIMARGKPGEMNRLKSIFGNIILGLVLILTAFVIVKTILFAVGYTDTLFFFN